MQPRGLHPPGGLVLLVGEDAETRAALRDVLQGCGAFVQEARSVAHARALMNETVPRVVVLDLRPPAESAWSLVRELRTVRLADGGTIPIVGVGPASLEGAAGTSGLDDYVAEPIDAPTLCRTLAALTR